MPPSADKYLEAGELLEQIRGDIQSGKHGAKATEVATAALDKLLTGDLSLLEKRVGTSKEALSALNDEQGWELVSKKKEMRMFQRWREGSDMPELQVKIEAVLGPDPPVKTGDVSHHQ